MGPSREPGTRGREAPHRLGAGMARSLGSSARRSSPLQPGSPDSLAEKAVFFLFPLVPPPDLSETSEPLSTRIRGLLATPRRRTRTSSHVSRAPAAARPSPTAGAGRGMRGAGRRAAGGWGGARAGVRARLRPGSPSRSRAPGVSFRVRILTARPARGRAPGRRGVIGGRGQPPGPCAPVARLPGAGLPSCHRGCCRCVWGVERSLAPSPRWPPARGRQGSWLQGASAPVVLSVLWGFHPRPPALVEVAALGRRRSPLPVPLSHRTPCRPRPSALGYCAFPSPGGLDVVKCGLEDGPIAVAFASSAEMIGRCAETRNRTGFLADGRGWGCARATLVALAEAKDSGLLSREGRVFGDVRGNALGAGWALREGRSSSASQVGAAAPSRLGEPPCPFSSPPFFFAEGKEGGFLQ